MDKQTIKIAVPANLNHSSLVRHVASEVFGIAKFSKAWCNRLKLVVDELFMNAVKYGSTEGKSTVNIIFEYDDAGVKLIMEDDGTGLSAIAPEELQSKIQANEQNTDLAKTSGRGLAMITKLWTDEMEVVKSQYGGIAISFVKRLETAVAPPPSPPPPPDLIQQVAAAQSATATVAGTGIEQQSVTQPEPTVTAEPPKGETYEIKLSGEIDQSNINEKVAPVYDQIEVMPENGTLVLDFSELDYINSTFIGNLAAWYTSLHRKGGHLCLKNVNDQIREVLELVGLLNILTCPVS